MTESNSEKILNYRKYKEENIIFFLLPVENLLVLAEVRYIIFLDKKYKADQFDWDIDKFKFLGQLSQS